MKFYLRSAEIDERPIYKQEISMIGILETRIMF